MKIQRNPISSLDDLSSDLGISKFIAPSKFPLAQDRKVENKTEPQEKSNWGPRSKIDFRKSFPKQCRILPFFQDSPRDQNEFPFLISKFLDKSQRLKTILFQLKGGKTHLPSSLISLATAAYRGSSGFQRSHRPKLRK